MNKITNEFRRLLGVPGATVERTERLGGMTNENYRIVSNQGEFVLRMPGGSLAGIIDREAEFHNSQLVEPLGIDVEILRLDPVTGAKLSRYVQNSQTFTVAQAAEPSNLERIAAVLRKLHHHGSPFVRNFEPLAEMMVYDRTIRGQGAGYFPGYTDARTNLQRIQADLQQLGMTPAPCHLDPWPENFVLGDDGKLFLIDWEYCGNFDPTWDLGAIWLELELTDNQMAQFLTHYYGEPVSENKLQKIKAMLVLIDVYWSVWALAKYVLGEPSLYEYGHTRFVRGKQNLAAYKEEYW